MIARSVTNDCREHGSRVADRLELTGLDQINQRAEPFLDAVDRVFGCQPFAARDGSQRTALGLGNLQQAVEHVLVELSWHVARQLKVSNQTNITRYPS
jgi:hypothetical protein